MKEAVLGIVFLWCTVFLLYLISFLIFNFREAYYKKKEAEANDKKSSKKCPKCGNTNLLLFRTLNIKTCTDCNTTIPWILDKGQKSVS